jgi:hypothetical protein
LGCGDHFPVAVSGRDCDSVDRRGLDRRGLDRRGLSTGVTSPIPAAACGLFPTTILSEFPCLAFKAQFKGCLCNIVRQKPMTTIDNTLRDFGIRYVEGFAPPNFADLVANAPFSE